MHRGLLPTDPRVHAPARDVADARAHGPDRDVADAHVWMTPRVHAPDRDVAEARLTDDVRPVHMPSTGM